MSDADLSRRWRVCHCGSRFKLPVHRFDGRNWEAAMAERQAAGKG